ncbi:hypothetical protein [Branchiibius sp. NY16-3462-2]|uniref:hypothetical protein n=1 Tax=Branchiibius sp. NY16-3462-2 TaxID=1807500 RepID=UPI0007969B73|nr:hypothetical protein [Branchiibius sp. NY16-3462-2]KYH45050.1 hypothetical protein AZH51_14280 [Branchiibius sp. NY16-3462-2]
MSSEPSAETASTNLASRILMVLATILTAAAMLAGLANFELLNGNRFAGHADDIRKDPAVASALGVIVTDKIITANTNLAALRPLVQSTTTSVIESDAAGPVFRSAVRPLHQYLTSDSDSQVLLQAADIAAISISALKEFKPDLVANVPADLDVTFSSIGSQSFAAHTLQAARWVRVLSWLLPLLAALCLLGAVLLGRRTWRSAGFTAGRVLLWAAGVFGGLVAIGVIANAIFTPKGLVPAVASAAWSTMVVPTAILTLIVGFAGLVLIGCARTLPVRNLREFDGWALRAVRSRPTTPAGWGLRVVGLGLLGVLMVLRPAMVIQFLVALAGVLLITYVLCEVLISAYEAASERGLAPRFLAGIRRNGARILAGLAALALLVSVTVFAWPQSTSIAAESGPADERCNGWVQLCDRPYNDVSFEASHNSMSALDENYFLAEQPNGIIGQLNAGVRVFLIDSWYGQATNRPGVIANSDATRAQAVAQANETFGASTVQSALRLRNSLNVKPEGPIGLYLCHELCELGATDWPKVMGQVKTWMDRHPREVVTFFVQDVVSPADVAKMLGDVGLSDRLYTPPAKGQDWANLGQMISSGKRLVWLQENKVDTAAYPWMLDGQTWSQDTEYTNPSVSSFSCALKRGEPDNPIFLMNHWLSGFSSLQADAKKVNARSVLLPLAQKCEEERGQIPNYVAVNYYNLGDLKSVVQTLNGLD